MQAAEIYLPLNMQANVFEMSSHALCVRFSYGNAFGDLFRGEGGGAGWAPFSGSEGAVQGQSDPISPVGVGTPSMGNAGTDAGRGEEHQVSCLKIPPIGRTSAALYKDMVIFPQRVAPYIMLLQIIL